MVGGAERSDRTPCGTEIRLDRVPLDQEMELVRIDLPQEQMEPLLEKGVLPGCRLCPVRVSPSGDPIVLVDGSLIALRKEMAACLCVMSPGTGSA
jgi:Fe2+ transport system protein FeoA